MIKLEDLKVGMKIRYKCNGDEESFVTKISGFGSWERYPVEIDNGGGLIAVDEILEVLS